MKRIFSIAFCLILTSCSFNQTGTSGAGAPQPCARFAAPEWQPLQVPPADAQMLVDKQKFAVSDVQAIAWFNAQPDLLGLCIPPSTPYGSSNDDCGTAYVIYEKREQEWELMDQRVTICPRTS